MTPEMVLTLSRQAFEMIFILAGPLLAVGLIVGVLISIFQAVTSIQDMTISFIPKILSIFVTLLLLLPWMMGKLTQFTTKLFTNFPVG